MRRAQPVSHRAAAVRDVGARGALLGADLRMKEGRRSSPCCLGMRARRTRRRLGHESPETTHQYVEADLRMKEEVLGKAAGVPTGTARYQPKGKLLAFLDSL